MWSGLQALFSSLGNAVRPWVVLAPWEAGLRIRMGRRVVRLTPGFNWKIPGIDRICVQTTRLRVSGMQMQTLTTSDGKALILSGNVGYSIADVAQLYNSIHHAEDTIRSMASEAVAEVVNGHPSSGLAPATVASQASVLLAPRLKRFGLADVNIVLTDFAFVRTYRLVSDQRWGNYGEALNVSDVSTRPA